MNQKKIDPIEIIKKYCNPKSEFFDILIDHSRAVQCKALEIAHNFEQKKGVRLDREFIKEAAMLHDIGVSLVYAPEIGCNGKEPYVKHGILGREILEKEGLLKHALVSERHIGVGITKNKIKEDKLPLPERDMLPESIEEKIICFADLFFSKASLNLKKEKNIDEIKRGCEKFGKDNIERLEILIKELLI